MFGALGDVGHVEGTLLGVTLDRVAGVQVDFLHLGRVVNELAQFAVLNLADYVGACLKAFAVEEVTDVKILNIGRNLNAKVLKHAVGEQIGMCYQLRMDRLFDGLNLCY